MAVVSMRKVELEKILRFMIASPEVLMEKTFVLWKFLNLPNPAVVAGRFVAVPRCRHTSLKVLVKIPTDIKYKDDTYRLAHTALSSVLMEGLRELGSGDDHNHWCWQQGGRNAVCSLLAAAIGFSEASRRRFIDEGVIGRLLALAEREEAALEDCRIALNVIVAREGENFGNVLATFFARGGLLQLAALAGREKCQEFVAKLLWLAWDAAARAPFAKPGGQGLKLLQALLRSELPSCSLLAGVLLSALIADGAFEDAGHRSEALRLVANVLVYPDAAASDPQFAKTLYGGSAAIVRLASLLEDVDLAPMILGLLCAARPPAAKLSRISGNLASIVSDKGGLGHSEETKARAAELLLHIQADGPVQAPPQAGFSSTPSAGGNGSSYAGGLGGGPLGSAGGSSAAAAAPKAQEFDIERCKGITEHEESLEAALRQQLVEGAARSREAMRQQQEEVQQIMAIASARLQAFPHLDFRSFDESFSSYKIAREAFQKVVDESDSLARGMERHIEDLSNARPSSVDPERYKERLLTAERVYADVKSRRADLAEVEADLKAKQAKAEASTAELRKANEDMRRYDEELNGLRLKKAEKVSESTKLRHRANTPNLQQMKQQSAESLERNLAEAKKLQVIGQRVQQGDPDYLKDGESREQKIAELSQKLQQLKKQHQVLQQEQKELDFDPDVLNDKASRLEQEATELEQQAETVEAKRYEAQRSKSDSTGLSQSDNEAVRLAKDRRDDVAHRLSLSEGEAQRVLSELTPMIQENHAGWQRLLGQQKKLESDRHLLTGRLEEGNRAAQNEGSARSRLAGEVQALMDRLGRFQSFLASVDGDAVASATPARASAPAILAAPDPFGDEEAFAPPPRAESPAAATAPAAASAAPGAAEAAPAQAAASSPLDDFDDFLNEDLNSSFAIPGPATAPAVQKPAVADDGQEAAPESSMASDFGEL
eukprot:TRINITY_DN46049_c0_g1_i1.p1 TRINITY_DN46049_c0_g1~~TRINITY_DN46049_c0_g1_i1.p1  ORF type:complete len:1054 (-),score=301.52 TRINITY_DN46049_c0_g1_i1:13-2850(-)